MQSYSRQHSLCSMLRFSVVTVTWGSNSHLTDINHHCYWGAHPLLFVLAPFLEQMSTSLHLQGEMDLAPIWLETKPPNVFSQRWGLWFIICLPECSAGTRGGTGLGKEGKEADLTPSAALWLYTELNYDIKHHVAFPVATVQTEWIIATFTWTLKMSVFSTLLK